MGKTDDIDGKMFKEGTILIIKCGKTDIGMKMRKNWWYWWENEEKLMILMAKWGKSKNIN